MKTVRYLPAEWFIVAAAIPAVGDIADILAIF
jgi:hypothetical protein